MSEMTYLEQELNELKDTLADMAVLVESQIQKSITALIGNDTSLAREVNLNEKRVDAYELKIDKDCEHIITLQNPMASDMRFVFSTLKINYNLERIGDHANGIAKYVMDMEAPLDAALISQLSIAEMAEVLKKMLSVVTVAYINQDSTLARSIFQEDPKINKINRAAPVILGEYIRTNPDKAILPLLNLLSVIRKLERVGDHLTNIAEEVIFSVDATVLKHAGKKKRQNP